jgi:hypothetical protein
VTHGSALVRKHHSFVSVPILGTFLIASPWLHTKHLTITILTMKITAAVLLALAVPTAAFVPSTKPSFIAR